MSFSAALPMIIKGVHQKKSKPSVTMYGTQYSTVWYVLEIISELQFVFLKMCVDFFHFFLPHQPVQNDESAENWYCCGDVRRVFLKFEYHHFST